MTCLAVISVPLKITPALAVVPPMSKAIAIAFDMGGTTAKAGVIFNGTEMTAGHVMVGGYNEGLPIQIPMIDIAEVGTGGGSIARVVAGSAMRVGPESAGAAPGPCLLYTSPSPRDRTRYRMPSSA